MNKELAISLIANLPLTVDAEFLLVVSQEVTKVNVEDLTLLVHHDVVRVSINKEHKN